MSTMSDINHSVHYSLFKGEPGVRKSSAAVTYPGPQYWFSFDQKMNALGIPIKKHNIDPKSIHYDDYKDWTSAEQKLEQLQLNCPYKTIVIDSITSCADMMLAQVLRAKAGSTRKSGAAAGKSIGGIATNELEDFNAESAGLTRLISLTKDIHRYHKVDVILIAHVIRTEAKDLAGNVNVSRVIVTAGKKPAAKIPAYCDETYHFGVESDIDMSKGGKYSIITSHVGDDYARTSLNLPTKIVIGDDNFYKQHILPAINAMSTQTTEQLKG